MTTTNTEPGTQAPWLSVYLGLGTTALIVAEQLHVVSGVSWWVPPMVALAGAVLTAFVTLLQESHRGGATGWGRVIGHRTLVWVAAGAWGGWVLHTSWHTWQILFGFGWILGLAALGSQCQTPAVPVGKTPAGQDPAAERDNRDQLLRDDERVIRSVTKLPITLYDWEYWDKPDDGYRLFAELPAELGTTGADLAQFCDKIAAAKRLPLGCAVRVLDSDRQGVVVVDVMTRNSLVDSDGQVYQEPTTPASINDDFPVLETPRGELLGICLRIFSMIVGGTTGSGKTTLLHRLIMWLARCVDALIWVIDLNGGGIAEPWISPYANGRTEKPTVDWVADNEPEAAAMIAVATEIAKDRKTNREATRRKKAANSMVLPVDKDMAAIVVVTDEGGEVRQAASLLGQLAAAGITRLAQIGRAEGCRVIMSVLRGTSDLTDKGLRVVAALRLCLRMEEHDEYGHVLGANPGKTQLSGAVGAGYLKTPTLPRPILGRTVNVDLAGIDQHAVACGPLRPDLDAWGRRAAAKVTPSMILGNREPTEEQLLLPVMRDAADGQVYERRWDRYAPKLAEMRGEDYDEEDPADPPTATAAASGAVSASAPAAPGGAVHTPALDAWSMSVGAPTAVAAVPTASPTQGLSDARVYQLFPAQAMAAASNARAVRTAREQILDVVRRHPDGISAGEIEALVDVVRSRVYDLLKQLRESGVLTQTSGGLYIERVAAEAAPNPTAS